MPIRDLGRASVLALPPEEQYLVATGRTYFGDLSFDQLRRIQFDLFSFAGHASLACRLRSVVSDRLDSGSGLRGAELRLRWTQPGVFGSFPEEAN